MTGVGAGVRYGLYGGTEQPDKGDDAAMDFLDSFSTTTQAIIVVLIFSGLTVAGLYFVRSRVSPQQLKEDHDVAGFTFSVVGAFYGVILAFVIVAVWQRFERANEKAQDESLALSNLYNLSGGFDQPARDDMQEALHTYATNVVEHEFKQMSEQLHAEHARRECAVASPIEVFPGEQPAADVPRQKRRSNGRVKRRAPTTLRLL